MIFNSQEDLVFFTEWILNYLKTDGQKFIETYSYLPNILKKMDELTAQGKTWQNMENGIDNSSEDMLFSSLV